MLVLKTDRISTARAATVKSETGPPAVVEHATIAAEADAALRPLQLHWLACLQRRNNRLLHLPPATP